MSKPSLPLLRSLVDGMTIEGGKVKVHNNGVITCTGPEPEAAEAHSEVARRLRGAGVRGIVVSE